MLTVLIISTYASDILKKELLQQAQRIHFFNVVETDIVNSSDDCHLVVLWQH